MFANVTWSKVRDTYWYLSLYKKGVSHFVPDEYDPTPSLLSHSTAVMQRILVRMTVTAHDTKMVTKAWGIDVRGNELQDVVLFGKTYP